MFRYSLWSRRARNLEPKCPSTVVCSGTRSLAHRSFSPRPSKKDVPNSAARPSQPLAALTGSQQLRRLQNDGIGQPGDLTRLSLPQFPRNFSVRIAPRHCLKHTDLQWFTEPGNVKGLLITEQCYDLDKTRPLWKSTLISGGQSIVRGKAKARLDVALLQALSNLGYDAHGKKVDSSKPSYPERVGDRRDAWRKEIVALYGTVHIQSHDALDALKRPFPELRRMFEAAVRSFEEVMGRDAAGKKASSSDKTSFSGRPQLQGRPPRTQNHSSFKNNPPGMKRILNEGTDTRKRGPRQGGNQQTTSF